MTYNEYSLQNFVGRSEHLKVIHESFRSFSGDAIYFQLTGITGCGKSTFLRKISQEIVASFIVDCKEKTSLESRLENLAMKIRNGGFSTPRFDLLWNLRNKYIISRDSSVSIRPGFQLASKIPEIGNLVGFAAISYSLIKQRYEESIIGVGGNWAKRNISDEWKHDFYWLLETHAKEALVLILKALMVDLNFELAKNAIPILLSFDQFETVDDSNHDYPFEDRNITEADLWMEFVKGMGYCVGIFATNRRMQDYQMKLNNVRDIVFDNLNVDECREYLEKREITPVMIPQIIKVSFQHPLTISTICDMLQMKIVNNLSALDADSIEKVYGKIWDRISRDNSTRDIIIDLALLDFFDVQVLSLIRHETKYALNSICRWSFISQSDNYFRLHDLMREIVLSSLGTNNSRIKEISEELTKSYRSVGNSIHLALAISTASKFQENMAIEILLEHMNSVLLNPTDAMNFGNLFEFSSQEGRSLKLYFEGLIFMETYQLEESKHKFQESLSVCHQLDTGEIQNLLFKILEDLSQVLTRLNQYDKAIECIDESLKKYRNKSDSENWFDLFTVLVKKGYILFNWDIFQSELIYSEAMQILKDNSSSMTDVMTVGRIAEVYNLGGLINFRKGDFIGAENLFRKSLDIAKNNLENNIEEWLEFYTSVMSNLGGLLVSVKQFDEAEDLFRNAIDMLTNYREKGNVSVKDSLATIFNQYSMLFDKKGNRMKAEQMHLRSIELSRELFDESYDTFARNFVINMRNYAFFLAHSGEYFAAEMYYDEAFEVCKKMYEDYPRVFNGSYATLISDIAILYTHTNRDLQATVYFENAIDIFRKMNFLDVNQLSTFTKALFNLGGIVYRENIDRTISLMSEAIDVTEILVSNFPNHYPGGLFLILESLFEIHLARNELNKAKILLKRIRKLCASLKSNDIGDDCKEFLLTFNSRLKKYSKGKEIK